MSHISRIDIKIKDLAALKTACQECGFEFVENQLTYKWYGTFVGDTPMLEGLTEADLGKCDHAIKVPGASYEIGVKQMDGGHYELLFDYWRSGGLEGKPDKLLQPYAIAATRRAVKANRYRIYRENKLDNGAVELRIRM